jgi:ubiquinone/menaquinone biosynthesis C-methylase UbiE
MQSKLQLRVQRYGWDAAAHYYQSSWQQALQPAHDALMSLANLDEGQSVLEIASGTGLVTFRVARAVGECGKVLATDLSGEMVSVLSQLVQDYGFENMSCSRMGAEALDVQASSFDRVICALGLMYTPSPEQALREMYRALSPGGRIVVTVWGERRNCGWAEIFPIVDAQVQSDVCPLFFATGNKGTLAQMAQNAGFERVEEIRTSEIMYFGSASELLIAMLDGGPVVLANKRFSPEARLAVEDQFLTSVIDYQLPDGSYHIPCEFVSLAATKRA